MHVLVVQNFDGTGLGQLGDVLAEADAVIDVRRAHLGEPLPADASGHDAMVVLGGAQNALADADNPYFPALIDLVRRFDAAGRSVLGICLGSQLMARAFGATNQIGGATEFGWCGVERTPDAAADLLMGAVPASFPIFQWHDDHFSLPPGASRLATSGVAANQAFRIGRATYGIQFHFEADRRLVAEWNHSFRPYLEMHRPDWLERWEEEAERHASEADRVGRQIARAWVSTIGRA